MEAFMVVILLTFSQVKDTNNVAISYRVKVPGIVSMDYCKAVEKAFADSGNKENAIVLCMEASKRPATKSNSHKDV